MTTEIPEILKREDRFLIVTHINPDGDAVGSLLGMYLALCEMGKQAWALLNDKFPDRYSFLPGHAGVLADSALVPGDPKWIISLDVAAEPRISADIKPFRDKARLINVDHHPTNDGFGDLNLIEPGATSTAELVFKILKQTGYKLSRDVGKCLYTGVVTDTGCFRFSGVNGSTLHLAAEMLESGFDSYEITRHVYEEYPLRRLELERLVLDRIEILLDGRFVMSTLFADDFSRIGASISESESLVNRLRESCGVEVGALLTQLSDKVCRASLRSKGRIDVAAIAQSLGGGGHKNAAGLRSTLPVDELRAKITEAVEAALA